MELAQIPVLILAGGEGTRLSRVTDLPKPLIPVAGRPFVTYLLGDLHQQGFRRIRLLAGPGVDRFEQALGEKAADRPAFFNELDIRFVSEPSPLGTGGALRQALSHVEAQALVLNGDSYCELDYRMLLGTRAAHSAAICLTAVRVPDARDFGCLALDADRRVTGFAEKCASGPGWINAGVYALVRRFLEGALPTGPSSLEREILPAWIAREATPAYCVHGYFRDIGTPERLAQVEAEFPPANLLWLE